MGSLPAHHGHAEHHLPERARLCGTLSTAPRERTGVEGGRFARGSARWSWHRFRWLEGRARTPHRRALRGDVRWQVRGRHPARSTSAGQRSPAAARGRGPAVLAVNQKIEASHQDQTARETQTRRDSQLMRSQNHRPAAVSLPNFPGGSSTPAVGTAVRTWSAPSASQPEPEPEQP